MRDFLVDTQTVRYWYDTACPQHMAVIDNVESWRKQAESFEHKSKLGVSIITLGEIEFGHRVQGDDHAEDQAAYLEFISREFSTNYWELTKDSVAAYGAIRSRLFDKYAPKEKRKPKMRPEQLVDPITSLELQIQENDLWLCAQAVAHQLVLVTNDGMRAIRTVTEGMGPALLIQNWTEVGTAKLE